MSSRGLWFKLGRGSMRSTSVMAFAAVLLVVAGATGLQRVAASLLPAKAKVANATLARHMSVAPTAENSLPQTKIVGVVEGKFDAKSQTISLLNSSNKDVKVGLGKVRVNSYGRVDANTVLPNGAYSLAFARSCAMPSGVAGCQSTAPNATVSAEFQITNSGTRKFYNTRQIFTDFRDTRGGIPISANAFFNDGQVPANGQLGVSRDFGDIDPNGGSQSRVWTFYFPAGSLSNFYFRYVIYADIGVAVESVEPAAVPNDAARNITINGQAFSSPSVELLNAGGASVATLSVSASSASQITAVVPANTTPGIYSVRVTNGGETAGGPGSSTLVGRLSVTTVPDAGHTGIFSSIADAGPYRITGNSTISGVVPAGAVIYIDNGVTLQIGSGLTADGGIPGVPSTSPAQIVFTSTAGATAWGGINAATSTGDVTLRNCVLEFGGNSGAGQIDISGSTRTLRFTDSISRRSAGHGIKATGVDDKFTGFTRSRIENNAGTAILLSANASLGNGAGMADLNSSNSSTNVPDQGYYYSAANVIRNNLGANAIQIDASANDFTKSGVLVGQGDIPIQILGSGANPSVVGNASGPTGAELNINPNAIIQLDTGMDFKAGDGTLFGNIAANGYAGWSHSPSGNTGISQRIMFDKISAPGKSNFGALFFSSKSAGSSILNFVTIQNGGSSGSGQAQLIIDNITYSFKFTNSQSTSSSSYGMQYRSDNTVDKSNSTLTGNTTGPENIIAGAVTLSSIAGAAFGDGLQGNTATIVKPTAMAVDPTAGVYFVDINDSPTMIRFLNTTNATVKIAGVDVPANTVKALTTGVSIIGGEQPTNSPLADVDFLTIRSIALSEDRKVLYVADTTAGFANVLAINVSPGVAKGSGNINIKNYAGAGVDVPTGNVRTVFDNDSVAAAVKISNSDTARTMAVNPTNGDLLLADTDTSKVIRIAKSTGAVSVFAGTGSRPRNAEWQAFSPGTATGVVIFAPSAITVGPDGTAYIADSQWTRVIRVQGGNAQLVTQLGNFDGAGKLDPATNPSPAGLAVLGSSLYIANSMEQTVVKVDNPATVTATAAPSGGAVNINNPPVAVVAGTATITCEYASTSCGDGGAASTAGFQFNGLNGNLQSDGSGLFIADQSAPSRGRIRYINRGSNPVTIAGVTIAVGNIQTIGGAGFAFPYDGGLALAARFENTPIGVAIDPNNNVWVSEAKITQGSRLRFINRSSSPVTMLGQIVPAGGIITINKDAATSGTDESTSPLDSYFYTLQGLTATSEGIYVVDSVGKSVPDTRGKKTSKLRFINTSSSPVTFYASSASPITVPVGEIRTIAGGSTDPSGFGDGGFATAAKLFGTTDVAIHPTTGDIYLSESANKKIRKIVRSSGVIDNVSGITDNVFTGLAFDSSGRLLVSVYNTDQVLRGTTTNNTSFSAIAGGGLIKGPRDVAVDSTGNIYVMNGYFVDAFSNANKSQIIKVPTSGAAVVFVGTSTGTPGFGGDGKAPDDASVQVDFGVDRMDIDGDTSAVAIFEQNVGIAVSASGEMIFADARNNRVRRVR